MDSLWSDHDARACVAHYAARGVCEELALRVYTARLLGRDPRLALHGGGNSSVKTTMEDVLGDAVPVVCVKGSGWDMASIEPEGFPAVLLEPLRRLTALASLTDEQMVSAHRGNLLDAAAPTPSVETLLHAFIPHVFVDHTHANALLALADQLEGAALCRDTYGDRVAVVPYVAPGFALAKAVLEAARAQPRAVGIVLIKHGIVSFGATARESYEHMIELVSRAEERLRRGRRVLALKPGIPADLEPLAHIAPILRGLTCVREGPGGFPQRRFILSFRTSPRIMELVNGAEVARYSRAGVATPDHVVWIKPWACILPAPNAGAMDAFRAGSQRAIETFVTDYQSYFQRHNAVHSPPRAPYDPMPRLLLVPGVGLLALGHSATHASAAADVAEAAAETILGAEGIGRFEGVGGQQIFDIEYWPLEQARMRRGPSGRLAQHIVVITGGAGTIGLATGRTFMREGAEVVLLDRDGDALRARAAELGALGIECDVTKPGEVAHSFDRVCEAFGGVDIVVSNAGAAWQGRIGEVPDALLRESLELNFFAHQSVAAAAVSVMRRQEIGGCLLFNVSKQAVNPGPEFGPYGLPKAATLALLRQYAIDYGAEGIRSCGVNADRIRGGMLTDEMIRTRSSARGVSEHEYMAGNLLRIEVSADDVGEAFVSLALARATSGAVLTVDGGNPAAWLR